MHLITILFHGAAKCPQWQISVFWWVFWHEGFTYSTSSKKADSIFEVYICPVMYSMKFGNYISLKKCTSNYCTIWHFNSLHVKCVATLLERTLCLAAGHTDTAFRIHPGTLEPPWWLPTREIREPKSGNQALPPQRKASQWNWRGLWWDSPHDWHQGQQYPIITMHSVHGVLLPPPKTQNGELQLPWSHLEVIFHGLTQHLPHQSCVALRQPEPISYLQSTTGQKGPIGLIVQLDSTPDCWCSPTGLRTADMTGTNHLTAASTWTWNMVHLHPMPPASRTLEKLGQTWEKLGSCPTIGANEPPDGDQLTAAPLSSIVFNPTWTRGQ